MQIISNLNYEIQLFLVIISSLILGSFASLVSKRLVNKQPIIFARSKCLECSTILTPLNLIPLFSWIFQRGKCSKCGSKISIRYPLIELSFLVSFLSVFFILDQKIDTRFIIYCLVASTLIIMIVTDLESYVIPDILQYVLAALAITITIMDGGTHGALHNISAAFLYAGFAVALYFFFYYTANIEAIGIDDIKFFFVVGLMLGIENFLAFMLFSGIFGCVFGVIWQKITKEDTFPFAPAICLASFLCLLFGKSVNPIEIIGNLIFFGV